MSILTVRFTSNYHNQGKFERIYQVDQQVLALKNKMSKYILDNFSRLLFDKKSLLAEYKLFKINDLSAWEAQTVFHDTIKLYENQLQKRKQNIDFKIQESTSVTYYRRATKKHQAGDVKEFKINTKKTELCRVVKYLTYCDLSKPLPEKIIANYKDRVWFPKIISFVHQKQRNLIKSIKLITFNTGTYRKLAFNGGTKYSYIFKDYANGLYKWWYRYKINKEIIDIPLQVNSKYHNDFENTTRFRAECYVKITGDKIHVLTTKNSQEYSFKEFTDILGVDINVKHNFCYLSDNTSIDYDRKWIGQAVKELKKYDKFCEKTSQQKNQISKITRRNEWFFKQLVSQVLDDIESKNISDVVLEDLNLSFGATYIRHPNFEIKYSRLVRLLRLSNIKTWFIQQANKRGIRVHLTNPAYTSQTCPSCGCISHENRTTQEHFECISCGYTNNADYNSSINIKNRITLDVLRDKLHTCDINGIYTPTRLRKESIKRIIHEYYGYVE